MHLGVLCCAAVGDQCGVDLLPACDHFTVAHAADDVSPLPALPGNPEEHINELRNHWKVHYAVASLSDQWFSARHNQAVQHVVGCC
jgi:hypothetical protein